MSQERNRNNSMHPIPGLRDDFYRNGPTPAVYTHDYANNCLFHNENQKYKIPAAWLIEKCGWKGYTDKFVGVYKDHALVIVNYKSESGETIMELSNKIRKDIKKTFSIELEVEVNIL